MERLLHLVNAGHVPRGGYRLTHPVSGAPLADNTLESFLALYRRHEEANGYPITSRERVIHELCLRTAPESCNYDDGTPPDPGQQCIVDIAGLISGTMALAGLIWDAVAGKENKVAQSLANQRAATCVRCPMNVAADGCWTCGLAGAAKDIIGRLTRNSRKTPHDHLLKACCCCGCSLEVIVHIPLDSLRKNGSPVKADCLERAPQCWQLTEI